MDKTQPSQKSREKAFKLFDQAAQNIESGDNVTPINTARQKRKRFHKTVAASLAFVAALGAVFGGSLISTGNTTTPTAPLSPTASASSVNEIVQTEAAHKNSFILTANAAEVKRGESYVTVSLDNSFMSYGGNEKTRLTDYNLTFPLTCEGENIYSVTYSISNALFFVHTLNNSDIIVSAVKPDKEINAGHHYPPNSNPFNDDNMTEDQYSSFTVKYDNQISDDVSIDIIGAKILSEEDYNSIFSSGSYDVESRTDINKKLLGDAFIDVTVQYTDGTTETRRITINSEVTYFDDEFKPGYVPAITFTIENDEDYAENISATAQ